MGDEENEEERGATPIADDRSFATHTLAAGGEGYVDDESEVAEMTAHRVRVSGADHGQDEGTVRMHTATYTAERELIEGGSGGLLRGSGIIGQHMLAEGQHVNTEKDAEKEGEAAGRTRQSPALCMGGRHVGRHSSGW